MGIKLLNSHTIPWCFRLLGKHFSCLHLHHDHQPSLGTIKLIDSDGVVKIYDRPIQASELMVEFPKHMVCRTDSFYIGQKTPALSGEDKLQLGHSYFLLPNQFFQSVLSLVTIASFAKASRNALLKKAEACQPFQIQKSSSGTLRIRVSDEFIWQLMETKEDSCNSSSNCGGGGGGGDNNESASKVCTTPQLQKRYSQLVGSRHWKPKLETIKETDKGKMKKKLSLLKKKKKNNNNNLKTQASSQHSQSKRKIKIKSSKK